MENFGLGGIPRYKFDHTSGSVTYLGISPQIFQHVLPAKKAFTQTQHRVTLGTGICRCLLLWLEEDSRLFVLQTAPLGQNALEFKEC